jgi:hypothetical protein
MAGREIGGNNEWRDLASVFSPMPSAAWFWSRDSGPASNGLLVPVANACRSGPSSDHLNGHRKSKRHEAVWRAVASRKGGWNNRRRNLATIPESCRVQFASTTSAPPQGGFAPATPATAPSPAPAQSGSLFPWQRPATPPAGSVASTEAGSASAQEAQYRCPGSTVVSSRIVRRQRNGTPSALLAAQSRRSLRATRR